jgi:hypothetical protein
MPPRRNADRYNVGDYSERLCHRNAAGLAQHLRQGRLASRLSPRLSKQHGVGNHNQQRQGSGQHAAIEGKGV